jgi:creatinine amidohydrolase/Fe(II)-dependent formamide hydrolase-like protein
MRQLKAYIYFAAIVFLSTAATAQIFQLAQLNTNQIRALDQAKTVVLTPGGILEEHGPYLPSFTDGYVDAFTTEALARAIVARPGWTVVIFPPVPLGSGPANGIGGKWSFPGSYAVRTETLRAVYMDLGSELGEQGFRWVFLLNDHGDPLHARALNEASEYFHEVYGGTMVHLRDLMPLAICCGTEEKMFTPEQQAEEGFTVHAGADEHSALFFLHPELVDPAYRTAPSLTAKGMEDLFRISAAKDWPGYFGAPRLTNAALGANYLSGLVHAESDLVLKILDGFDYRTIPHFSDQFDPQAIPPLAAELDHDRQWRDKELNWLKSHSDKAKKSSEQPK